MFINLIIYFIKNILQNLEISEMATCLTFIFFAAIALVMLYGYCLIGDQLTQQVLLKII
jgi:hypothetical protein